MVFTYHGCVAVSGVSQNEQDFRATHGPITWIVDPGYPQFLVVGSN